MTHESTAAWRELLETLGGLDRSFLEGDRAVTDDRHIADGYRMLATTLGVAFDTYLFAEPSRPMWVEVNTPFRRDRRWGGDNTDAYYFMCPVDPKRRYRISGNKGDSVYFSVTAYNEPSPGAWSDRIVAIVRDDDLDIDDDRQLLVRTRADARRRGADDPRLSGRPADRTARQLAHRGARRARPVPARRRRNRCGPAGQRGLAAHDVRDPAAGRRRAGRRRAHARARDLPGRKRIRRSLPGAGRQLRLVGTRRLLRVRQLRARGRRGAGDHPSAADVPVLEPGGVEPVHGDPRRRRRTQLGQRPQRGAERRRFGHDRRLPRHDGAPEFPDHTGLSARQSRLQVVPRRRGARPPGGAAGEGVRRADDVWTDRWPS